MADENFSLYVDSPNARQRMDEMQKLVQDPLGHPLTGQSDSKIDPVAAAFAINAFGPDTFPAPPPESKGGVTSRAIKRGYYNTKASLAEVVGDLLEIKSFQDAAAEANKEAQNYPPEVESFMGAGSLSDFMLHGYETIVEQAPMLATLFVGGGAVGLGARALGAGVQAAKVLGTAGGFATDVGLLGGEAGQSLRDAGVDPTTQKTGILMTGVANAALDFIPFITIAGRMGLGPLAEKLIVDEGIKRGLWKKVGQGALLGIVTEVPTETTQEINNMVLRNIAQNKDALNLTDQDIAALQEVAIGSAFAGGALGAFGGAFEGKRKKAQGEPGVEQPGVEPGAGTPPPPGVVQRPGGRVEQPGQPVTDEDIPPYFPPGYGTPVATLGEQAYVLTPEGRQVYDPEASIPLVPKAAADQQVDGEATQGDEKQIVEIGNEQRKIAQMVYNAQKTLKDDPITRRLFNVRQQVIERSAQEDGTLSKEGQAKVEAIDQKIDEIAKQKGIENPKLDLLNDREMERYQYLMEKEAIEGLTDKEYSTLEKLIAKAQGERRVERKKATPELDAELEAEVAAAPDQALYSTQFRRPKNGMTKEALEAAIASVRVPGEGGVEIYNNPLELGTEYKSLRDNALRSMAQGRNVEGGYIPAYGKTFLFAENITPERAVPVYMHEVIAHHGLRAALNPDEMQALVRAVMVTNPDAVKQYLEKRGLLPSKENVEKSAEEYIARIAETGTDLPLLRKVIAIIKRALRRLFGTLANGITDDEIRVWLGDIRKDLSGREIGESLPGEVRAARYIGLADAEGNIDDWKKATDGYTMRIMDRIEKRDWITPGLVRTALKKISPNKIEVDVVNEVLKLPGFGEKFMRKDFEMELMHRVVPLESKMYNKYGDYGLHRLFPQHGGEQMLPDYVDGNSRVWRFPFAVEVGAGPGGTVGNHFDDPNYAGHTRIMVKSGEAIHYIVEIQSDFYQRYADIVEGREVQLMPEQEYQDGRNFWSNLLVLRETFRENVALTEFNQAREDGSETVGPNHPAWRSLEGVLDRAKAAIEKHTWGNTNFSSHLTEIINLRNDLREASPPLPNRFEFYQHARNVIDDMIDSSDTALIAEEGKRDMVQQRNKGALSAKTINTMKGIYRRMVREELRDAAQNGIEKVLIAGPMTVANIEGHVPKVEGYKNIDNLTGQVEKMIQGSVDRTEIAKAVAKTRSFSKFLELIEDNRRAIIYARHEALLDWARKNFDGKIVRDENGFDWLEIPVKEEYKGKVVAYASDPAREAYNLLSDVGIADHRLPESLDRFNRLWGVKTLRRILTPLQMSKIFKLEPSTRYVNFVDRYAATKGDVIGPAQEVVDRWTRLGSDDAQRLSAALFEATIESDELGRRLEPEEEQAILAKYKVEGPLLDLYADIGLYFRQLSERLESGLKYNAIRETLDTKQEGVDNSQAAKDIYQRWEQTRDDPAARSQMLMELFETPQVSLNLNARLVAIEADFEKLRNRNYFPYMRFGQYVITVRAGKDGALHKGKEFKKGQVVQFWTFEDKKSQEEFFKDSEMSAMRQRGYDVAMSLMEDRQFSFLAMPPSLINTIDERLGLNNAQREELKELFIERSPGRAFLRHLLKRKGIDGFSQDAMRVFATYAMNAANHIARVENYVDMDKSLSDLKDMRYDFEARQQDSRGLMELYNSYNEHFNYLMNPGNDLAKYRALGFMFFLGFNVKSAAVNLTQIPMVVYPVLAAKYGDVAAVSELAKGMKSAMNYFRGKGIDPVMDSLIAQGIREGVLDESQATELAGVGEASVLQRVLPSEKSHRLINQFTLYGTYLFKQAEKFTRLAAFSAVVRLELARGATAEQAYTEAKEAVRTSLFEYAKWNRPEFMRGKKSVFFLFWTYMQHLSFLAFGGAGSATAMRIWIMMLLMAGIQGLPFMENILDILDFGLTKVKQATGMKDPYTDLRTDIRKLLLEFTDTPDLIMHGMGRYYGLGPLHLLELAGIPVPRVDVSGSLSMGRVIPGLDQMLGPERNIDEKFGRTVVELMGPVFAMPYMLYRAANDSDPDSWKRWERAMPIALKSASKASRWMVRGEEEFRGGGVLAEFNPLDVEHHAEIAAQSLGFAPTRVQQRYERRAAIETAKEYWLVRRQMLLEDYAYVKLMRHREGLADVRSAIKEFNATAPHWKLKIDQETLAKSIESRRKSIQARQKDVPTARRFVPLSREFASAYPEAQP